MVITNITPSRVSSYLAALAHKASAIPGCKVKQSHLLEAASKIEGESNWRALEDRISKQKYTHTFLTKEVSLLWIDGQMVISGTDIEVSVRGFAGTNIRVNANFKAIDGFWMHNCEPQFISNKMDGSTGMLEALDNFKTALTEVTEVCNWLNEDKRKLRIQDFGAGWCLRVNATSKLDDGLLGALRDFGFVQEESKNSPIGLADFVKDCSPVMYHIKGVEVGAKRSPKLLHKARYVDNFSLFNRIKYCCDNNPGMHVYFERAPKGIES